MRLLQRTQNGDFKLTNDLVGDRIPLYAILSHTWGPDTEEVTLKDLVDGVGKGKIGYEKIKFCAEVAGRDGLQYFWVDTCCIDKSNNSELSEAINSMFRWYRNATRCYVFLSDVSTSDAPQSNDKASWEPAFQASRWFTRGWTLQELLAPASVEFFTRDGVRLGEKISLSQEIHRITRIPVSALEGRPPSQFNVEERLAWAATRQTTREEDWAYCLLGIFGIFMPLIYGEGREHAIGRLKKEIHNALGAQAIAETPKILDWLEAPDGSIEYKNSCKKRHPGTGLWLVEGPSFTSWLEQPNSFMWLNGFAGCGKSVLCSTAIQHTFRQQSSRPRIGVAFFFFVFDDRSKQTTSAMLRALVLQLSSQLEDNHSLLSQLQRSYRNTTVPDAALADCLHQLIRMFDHAYILLDALDESPKDKHREDVLEALVNLHAFSEPRLHLLVTSRKEADIHDVFRNEFGASPNAIISMKNKSVDHDIANFTAQHLRDNRKLQKWKAYNDQIEARFAERAKGVFRWVACQFKALEQCPQSRHLLDQLLDSLPESLVQTYERMLLNIASTCVEYSKSMLTLLCCARRPLTVPELVDGIAVELGSPPKFNPSRRLETVEALHEVCPGFIEVDEEVSGKAATVRIAHFSVQEYLESERILRGGAAKFSVRKIDAHSDVACICVTYLLDPALSASTNHETEFPLSLYAARSWPEHIREGDEKKPHFQQQTLRLFQSVEKFESWVSIWNVDDYYGRKPAGVVSSPVYYASLLGLYELLSRLLSGNTLTLSEETVSRLVNAQGGEYGNALQASSARGYEAVVRLLLEKHADVNAQGGYYGTALQAASAEGHVNIVQLLLQRNAKVHARGGEYGNALYAASARGYEVIVRLLLSKGADVNARGGEYGNALYAASARGDKGIVQMLLDGNAKINAQSSGYGTALYAASSRGHEAVVRILLERNAAVDAQGGEYGNALYAATSRGYEAIVRLLLDKNANVNALAGFYGSALQAASAGGHNKIFNLLQARSAQRNTMSVSEQRKSIAQRAESIRLSKNLMEMKPFDQTTAERKGRRGTGAVGLTNLGNTGYMASPLQCLRSVEELTSYFLTGEYANDLNKQNPLGYNGEVAIAYCNLLNDLYHTSNDSIRPSNFKKTIASFVPSFSGQGQESAQEFLGMLIDGLQEDLSRVKKKPYIEKPISTDDMVHNDVAISKMADEIWNITMKRDDSVVMDLFTGLYKSTLKCPVCQKIDISFDPFISFTLQLPEEPAMWTHTVVFFPLNDSPVQIQVEILETSAVVDMKHFVSNRTGVPVRRLICAEQSKCQFWQIFDDLTEIGGIRENDLVTMHELAVSYTHLVVQGVQQLEFLTISKLKTSKRNMNTLENARYKHVIVPVIHRRGNEEIRKLNHDGVPAHFIALDREEARTEDAVRRKVLEKVDTFTTWKGLRDDYLNTAEMAVTLGPKSGDSKVPAKSLEEKDDLVKESKNLAPINLLPVLTSTNLPTSLLKAFNKRRPRWVKTQEPLHPSLQNMFELSYFSGVHPSYKGTITGGKIADHEIFPPAPEGLFDPVSPTSQGGGPSGDSWEYWKFFDNDSGLYEIPSTIKAEQGAGIPGNPEKIGLTDLYKMRQRENDNILLQNQQSSETVNHALPNLLDSPIADDNALAVVRFGEALVVDWKDSAWDMLFGMDSKDDPNRGDITYLNIPKLYDPILEQQRDSYQPPDTCISIDDCLNKFEQPERLAAKDTWYCPRCKEHRRALKKFDIWKTPDILVCHLKRFFDSPNRRGEMIDKLVTFPIEGLDLEKRVLKQDGKIEVYDLIGVVDRHGGPSRGHYMASAKNFIDGNWYHYDDSIVEPIENPNTIVNAAAELLFYRRRSEQPLGRSTA